MPRALLLHWKESELPERLARLRSAGWQATTHSTQQEVPKIAPGRPPDAILIDLSRLPSHGRTYGYVFRHLEATRNIPLIFLEGDPAKVRKVRELLPDATYATWAGLDAALRRALTRKPARPIVPRSFSGGYSGTPLPKKLGADKAETVALLGAPQGFEKLLVTAGKPRILRGSRTPADLVIWFAQSQAALRKGLAAAKKTMAEGAGLWACWPKKSSAVASDLSDSVVRETLLRSGLVDYKVCAIDETWSGLKFARRRK